MHVENRPAPPIGNWQVIGLGKMRCFLGFSITAIVTTVWLQDVNRFMGNQFAQAPPMSLHLAGGYRNVGTAAQIGQGPGIVLVQRLLEPGKV